VKVALVHDQLQEFGGAERVLVSLTKIFPEAPVYTSFYDKSRLGAHAHETDGWDIRTSWADKLPFMRRLYSPLRFITPLLWESIDFSGFDLVISSSGSYMSKGIVTKPRTKHVCYMHHPPRYLYYYPTAIEWQKYAIIKAYGNLINHDLRMFDYLSSQRVDHFIANSEETKKRIGKFYRRDATVIYPPVTIPTTVPRAGTGSYYLTVARLAKAKNIDILVKAANKLKIPLKIVGTGRDEEYLKSLAGPTVELIGNVRDNELETIYAGAKAFLFASVDEEFGIAPVEAMGYGLPVIAFASGGLLETVIDGKNGYLFRELTPGSLAEKISALEKLSAEKYSMFAKEARSQAEKYSQTEFKKHLLDYLKTVMK